MDMHVSRLDESLMMLEEKQVKQARDMIEFTLDKKDVEAVTQVPAFNLKDFVAV